MKIRPLSKLLHLSIKECKSGGAVVINGRLYQKKEEKQS